MATSPAGGGSGLTHHAGAVDVVLRLAVREVQADNVYTGLDEALQHLGVLEAGPRVATILVARVMA